MSKIKDMKLRYKVAAGVATGAAVLGMAGGAFAYWTNSGSGTGSATAGKVTANSITVTDDSANLNDLGPGVADQNISVTFANNDGFSEWVTNVQVTLTVTPLSGKTCDASNYEINGTQYTAPVTLPIGHELTPLGTSNASYTAMDLYKLGFNDEASSNQDGCQGATVNIAYASA